MVSAAQPRDDAREGREAVSQGLEHGGIWTFPHGCANARYLVDADGYCRSEQDG